MSLRVERFAPDSGSRIAPFGGGSGDGVAQVAHRVVAASHIPTAPPVFERALVTGQLGSGGEDRVTRRVREHRAHHEAGHIAGHRSGMAVQAFLRPQRTSGPIQPGAFEKIEDRPGVGIDGAQFHRPAGHPADVDLVAKIESPRGLGADPTALHAGLREDQHLGGCRHFEGRQHPAQPALIRLRVQLDLPAVQPGFELGDAIGQWHLPVVGRLALVVVVGRRPRRPGASPAPRRPPTTEVSSFLRIR